MYLLANSVQTSLQWYFASQSCSSLKPFVNEEKLLDGYEYSVVYKLDPEKQCIYAAYSQEFKDALYSNAEDGVLQRN